MLARRGSGRGSAAAHGGGGTCQNVAWICIIPNPDMLLLHTAVAQAASSTSISTELFILPDFWKVSRRGGGGVVVVAGRHWPGVAAPR